MVGLDNPAFEPNYRENKRMTQDNTPIEDIPETDEYVDPDDILAVDAIINILRKTPAQLHIYDHLVIPYCLHSDQTQAVDIEVEIDEDENTIKLYNMLTDQYEQVPIEALGRYDYRTNDDREVIVESLLNDVELDREEIKSCVDNPDVDRTLAEVIALYCDTSILPHEWAVIKKFNLRYTMDQLRYPDAQTMSELRDHYMNLIRTHREKSLLELDELERETKEAGGTQEDLDDIDTIKQMFRDIPQDVDLTKYNTIHELYQFWPSLLLPKPKDLLTIEDLNAILPQETAPDLAELHAILQSIDDLHALEALLLEIEDIKSLPEGAYDAILKRREIIKMTSRVQTAQ